MEEEALVQAVLDRPGDEGALDALASFLEECDDPRGEVLRLVVEAARAGAREPMQKLAERMAGFFAPPPNFHGLDKTLLSGIPWYDVAVGLVSHALIFRREMAAQLASGITMGTVYQSVHDETTWLREEGARELAGDPHAASLRSLDVERHRLGPQGVTALCGSPHLAGLVELRLTGNLVGEEGMEALRLPHISTGSRYWS
jgi:hypothetical protein